MTLVCELTGILQDINDKNELVNYGEAWRKLHAKVPPPLNPDLIDSTTPNPNFPRSSKKGQASTITRSTSHLPADSASQARLMVHARSEPHLAAGLALENVRAGAGKSNSGDIAAPLLTINPAYLPTLLAQRNSKLPEGELPTRSATTRHKRPPLAPDARLQMHAIPVDPPTHYHDAIEDEFVEIVEEENAWGSESYDLPLTTMYPQHSVQMSIARHIPDSAVPNRLSQPYIEPVAVTRHMRDEEELRLLEQKKAANKLEKEKDFEARQQYILRQLQTLQDQQRQMIQQFHDLQVAYQHEFKAPLQLPANSPVPQLPPLVLPQAVAKKFPHLVVGGGAGSSTSGTSTAKSHHQHFADDVGPRLAYPILKSHHAPLPRPTFHPVYTPPTPRKKSNNAARLYGHDGARSASKTGMVVGSGGEGSPSKSKTRLSRSYTDTRALMEEEDTGSEGEYSASAPPTAHRTDQSGASSGGSNSSGSSSKSGNSNQGSASNNGIKGNSANADRGSGDVSRKGGNNQQLSSGQAAAGGNNNNPSQQQQAQMQQQMRQQQMLEAQRREMQAQAASRQNYSSHQAAAAAHAQHHGQHHHHHGGQQHHQQQQLTAAQQAQLAHQQQMQAQAAAAAAAQQQQQQAQYNGRARVIMFHQYNDGPVTTVHKDVGHVYAPRESGLSRLFAIVEVYVFVPHRKKPLNLRVPQTTNFGQLAAVAIKTRNSTPKLPPGRRLEENPEAYLVRIAGRNGQPDERYPGALSKRNGNIESWLRFAFCLVENPEYKARQVAPPQEQKVHLTVFLPSGSYNVLLVDANTKMKKVLQMICAKRQLTAANFMLMVEQISYESDSQSESEVGELEWQSIPGSVRVGDLESTAVTLVQKQGVATMTQGEEAWYTGFAAQQKTYSHIIFLKKKNLGSSSKEKSASLDIDPDAITVTVIRKKRQPKTFKLAFETITGVHQSESKPTQFHIECADHRTLMFEAPNPVMAKEIIFRIQFLIDMENEARALAMANPV